MEDGRHDGTGGTQTTSNMNIATGWSASGARRSNMLDRKLLAMSPPSSRSRLRVSLAPLVLVLWAFLTVLVPKAEAAMIAFDNCLPDRTKDSGDPMPLQWVPLYLDAAFDTENESHTLRITTWGNVTGSYRLVDLPPANDPSWKDPEENDGKIQRLPQPDVATTLVRKINILTYEPFHEAKDFCRDALVNGSCPLPPVFDTTEL